MSDSLYEVHATFWLGSIREGVRKSVNGNKHHPASPPLFMSDSVGFLATDSRQ